MSGPPAEQSRSVAGTNLEYARSHNRRAVLEVVRRNGPLSRAEIARETALTGQTISNIVEELEAAGLLIPGEPRRKKRGQPSIPYAINPAGAWSLGFHVDHRAIIAALVDLSGKPVAVLETAAARPSPDEAMPVLRAFAERLIGEAGIPLARVLGAGLALPVRFDVGPISTAGPTTLPGWDEPQVPGRLAAELGLPVLIENDAMAAAIGERLHGVAKTIDSFVLLFVDDGLGAGIFLGGQPWKGAFLNAGEIGHMVVAPGGRPCPCGNSGCLERYVSLRAAYESLCDAPDEATPQTIAAFEEQGSPALARWIADAAPHLATTANILESILDPDTIILGGIAPTATLQRLIDGAQPLPMSVGARSARSRPRLMLGGAGRHIVALGAAALPIFEEINPRFDVLLKR